MNFPKKIPLRTAWYGLIILASLLPAIALSPWLSQRAHELLLDHAMVSEELFHDEIETHLYLETERLVSVLQNKSDPIVHFMSQGGNFDVIRNLIEKIGLRESMINTTTLYDQYAKIILSSHHGEHAAVVIDEDAPAFVIPMHQRVYIGAPGRVSDGHFAFLIAVPLIIDNTVAGVLVSTININDFWHSIRAKIPEHHSKVYLIDGRGSLLTHLSETIHRQGDLLSGKEIVRTLLAGKDWHRTDAYEGFEGRQVFGIATLVRNLQWGIISEIPSKEITAPIISALITLIIIVVLLHVIFGLLSLMFTRRLLNPISELARAVKAATQGDYSHDVRPSPYREIDELSTSFNTMIHEIEKRETSLRKLSQAVTQAGGSIMITDVAGIIEYINPAFTQITGYSAEEAIGQTASLLKSGKQDAVFYAALWKRITAGKVWHGKVIDKRKDGSLLPAMLTIAPIQNSSGVITNFVGSHADMSALERLELQFYQVQKMEAIGTMVGGIAHNFNNALAGMTGNLYLAKQRIQDKPDVVQKLTNVEELSQLAAGMIQQLLSFACKGLVNMKKMPFTPFVKETLTFLHSSLAENVALHQDLCADDLPINGDGTQLHQVLMNLVSNASDAVEDVDSPSITIRLETFHADEAFLASHPSCEACPYAHLSVADNGCGIPEDQFEQLFEPFFTTKEQGRGTGLGLSMVYGAIKTHHGFVDVDSIQGKGSTFHIYIPLSAMEDDAVDAVQVIKTAEGRDEFILLADDDKMVRDIMAEVLESFGYQVLLAADGLEAVTVFKAHQDKIALALLDVVMPHLGGMQLARRIREMQPDVPVIFLTGYDKERVLGDGEQIQNCMILTKPVYFDVLSRNIRQLLDKA